MIMMIVFVIVTIVIIIKKFLLLENVTICQFQSYYFIVDSLRNSAVHYSLSKK